MAVIIKGKRVTSCAGAKTPGEGRPIGTEPRGVGRLISAGPCAVLAFDISSKTGVVALAKNGNCITAKELVSEALSAKTAKERVKRSLVLGQHAFDLIDGHKPPLVVVEGYATHGKFINYTQFELGAAVRFACFKAHVPFIEVSPTTLKKFVVGSAGSAKNKVGKDKMRLSIYKRWDFEHDSDNVLDAYGLAHFGLVVLGFSNANQEQKKLVDKFKGELDAA